MAALTPALSPFHLTTAGTYVLQGVGGTALLTVNVNTGAASSSLTIYDNIAASGTVVSVVSTVSPVSLSFNYLLTKGCTVVIAGGNPDVLLTFGEPASGQSLILPVPVSQGGTGSSVEAYVDLSTAQTVAGSKTFTGANTAASGNLTVGSSGSLGDNGVGVIQLANATTVPTTNPSSGAVVYTTGGGLYTRDVNGTVSSLVSTLRTGATSWGAVAETINHNAVSQTVLQPASGELQIMAVGIEAGQTISNIGFCTGGTAAVLPAHWWAVVLDINYKQMAHSLDQTTTALPASTWQKLAMVTPYVTTYTGQYFIGLMVATTGTQPSLLATTVQSAFVSGTNAPTPGIGGRSSTALTTPGTDGTTVYTTPTTIGGYYYAYAI